MTPSQEVHTPTIFIKRNSKVPEGHKKESICAGGELLPRPEGLHCDTP